ncbi:MAG: hypothetical protein IJS03_03620 [Eubacterium sp.]|nr:hypothetical protein [Eubacterium sp.]
MTALMLTVLLGFTALSIDIGLHYYLGARLQNAVDSAAVAIGQKLESDQSELDKTAYDYLAKNGYDNKNGEYKDRVSADIEFIGVQNLEVSGSVDEADDYITKGYFRLIVDVDDSTLFANVLGIKQLHLRKVAYVMVEPEYEAMPEALKFSIFAGASKGDVYSVDENGNATAYVDADHPAIDLQGSTGAGSGDTAFSSVVAVAEQAINGVNDFIQDIKGFFGLETDYNSLVNINVSEMMMNNDVHSNSNVMIGVQAFNASRLKDTDYDGDSPAADDQSNASNVNQEYTGLTDATDYGQVRVSAVNDIKFGYSNYAKERQTNFINKALINYLKNHPELTRVYVQNQQDVQAVQHVVNILNEMNLNNLNSGNIATEYQEAANQYFRTNSAVSTDMQNKVKGQKNYLSIDTANNTITLTSQEAIVYRVSQEEAANYLTAYQASATDGGDVVAANKTRFEALLQELADCSGYDVGYENGNLVYAGTADKADGEGINTTITLNRWHKDDYGYDDKTRDPIYSYKLVVGGSKVNRNVAKALATSGGASGGYNTAKTNVGAKYATVRTFKEKSQYIDMPNLKPFFTRQINQSIRDATKKRGQFTDGVTTGARTVKEAVKIASDELKTVKDSIRYTDDTFADKSLYDSTYARRILFQSYKAGENTSLTKLTSTKVTKGGAEMSTTSFRGYDLYDSNGKLKNGNTFVQEFKNIIDTEKRYGVLAVNDYEATVDSDRTAVEDKKTEIQELYGDENKNNLGNKSYQKVGEEVRTQINSIPKPNINMEGESEDPGSSTDPVDIVVTKPTIPDLNQIFLAGPSSSVNGTSLNPAASGSPRVTFNTEIAANVTVKNESKANIVDSDISIPSLASGVDASVPNYGELFNSKLSNNQMMTNTVKNYVTGKSTFNAIDLINTIGGQWSWNGWNGNTNQPYGANVGDQLVRCNDQGTRYNNDSNGAYHRVLVSGENNVATGWNWIGGVNERKSYVSGDEHYKRMNYNGGRGFFVSKDTYFWANEYMTTNDNKSLIVRGTNLIGGVWTPDTGQNLDVKGTGDINLRSESGASLIVNGNTWVGDRVAVGSTSDNKTGNLMFVKGNLIIHGGGDEHDLWVAKNNVLIVDGDLTLESTNNAAQIHNDGTIIVTGTITCKKQIYNGDSCAATMYAGNISASGQTINNYPGSVLKVGNNLTCGTINNQSNSNNANAARAYMHVGGTVSCSTFNNYQPSTFLGDGNISASTINNKANCIFKTNGSIGSNSSVIGTIENDSGATMSAGDSFNVGSLTNSNNAVIYANTFKNTVSIVNSNIIRCTGNMSLAGDVSSNGTNSAIETRGAITGSANLDVKKLIAKSSITANSLTSLGDVKTNGNITLSGAFTIEDSSTVISNGSIEAGSITNKRSVYAKGSLSATSSGINNNEAGSTLKIGGNISANTFLYNKNETATINCVGNMTVGYAENWGTILIGTLNSSGNTNYGAFTMNSKNSSNSNRSLDNRGIMYVTGTVTAKDALYNKAATLYVYGDVNAVTESGNDALDVEETCTIYVRGCLSTSNSGRKCCIWTHGNGTSVISILGDGHSSSQDAFKNNFNKLCNQQSGCQLFVGTGMTCSASGNDAFENGGRAYVFGPISCPSTTRIKMYGNYNFGTDSAFKVDGTPTNYSGLTYCLTSFTAANADIIIEQNHLLYIDADPEVEAYNLTGRSLSMYNNSIICAQSKAKFTETVNLYNNAIFNCHLALESRSTPICEDESLAIAPYEVVISGASNLSNLRQVTFTGDQSATSLTFTNIAVFIDGNLNVSGAVTLKHATLIVTKKMTCNSLTLTNVPGKYNNDGSQLRVMNEDSAQTALQVSGAVSMKNSQCLIDKNPMSCTNLTVDLSTLFVTDGISSASNVTLTDNAIVVSRDNNSATHNDDMIFSGDVNASGTSQLLCNGNLTCNTITANGGSDVAGYERVHITETYLLTNPKVTISTDLTTHLDGDNSLVYCGENTSEDDYFDLDSAGSIYLPPTDNKYGEKDATHLGRYAYIMVRDTGLVVVDSDIQVRSIQVGENDNSNATLYVKGTIFLYNCTYTNYGKLYAIGGTDVTRILNTQVKFNFWGGTSNYSETYVGKIYQSSLAGDLIGKTHNAVDLTYSTFYEAWGHVYIDTNLVVNNYTSDNDKKVGKRYTYMYLPQGTTYVSGNVTMPDSNGVKVLQNGGLCVKGNLTMGSAIENRGKIHIFGDFILNQNSYPSSDGDQNSWTILNEEGASFLVWNGGTKNGELRLRGNLRSYGNFYINKDLSVQGWGQVGDVNNIECTIVNGEYANTHIAGYCRLNSNCFYNMPGGVFSCGGKFTFGSCMFNHGTTYIGGDCTNDESDAETCNSKTYRIGSSRDNIRCVSLMNGIRKNRSENEAEWNTVKDATLYVGGTLKLGTSESAGNAGSVYNAGTIYTGNDFKIFTNKDNDYYKVAGYFHNNSTTFVGGDFFGGGGVATGKNSIFATGGDFRSKRALKLNEWFAINDWGCVTFCEDHEYAGSGLRSYKGSNYSYDTNELGFDDESKVFRSAYLYVGGSLYANPTGKKLKYGTDNIPWDGSRDTDIQSNTNIYVEGNFYCPTKLYLKQNVAMIVKGNDSIFEGSGSSKRIKWQIRAKNENDSDRDDVNAYGPDVSTQQRNWLSNRIDDSDTEDKNNFTLLVYQALDINICSKMVVGGNMYARDTAKIRDMTKTYIYGNFEADDYLEVGKSLTEGNKDATQALESAYREEGETLAKYQFSNAGYMYVKKNLTSSKYTKIYASTSVRVGGDMKASNLVNGYITLRHDANLFVGGEMKAMTSIDVGAYSEVYVHDNMTATLSTMKLRDQTTVYVGGNLQATSYIELGKYDENFYRGIKKAKMADYLNEIGDAMNRPIDDNGSTTDGSEFNYNNGDDNEREDGGESGNAGNDNQNEGSDYDEGTDDLMVNEESELGKDETDRAVGAEFYIGGNIVTLTSYIREYAYSRVVSGGYVVSLEHITLRHNSDMWVLPEVFGHPTFHTTEYQHEEGWDATLWSRFVDTMQSAMHSVSQAVTPKTGSIYSLGQLTMNKNTSIFGTYDTMIFGQTVMRKGSLVFMGHDFDCWAPMYTLQFDTSSLSNFWESIKGNLGLSSTKSYKGFDSYDETQSRTNPKPIVIYANNEINIATTARIRTTYFVANRGDVNFRNLNFASDTSETNMTDAKVLPNAFASYQGDINYYALKGYLGALFYAPAGHCDLDGFAYNYYGSVVGHTVSINTFYINVHRFENWSKMDLHIACAKKVYLVSEREYESHRGEKIDDIYMYGYDTNPDPNINEWAQPFFPGLTDTGTSSQGEGDDEGSESP